MVAIITISFFIAVIVLVKGCKHNWKIIADVSLVDGDRNPIGRKYHLQCTKCGDVKKKRL
jgi:hypothetical protein